MTEMPTGSDHPRHELYEIMKRDLPFEEKAELALELGKEYLGVENGHVTRLDEESSYWKAIASTDPTDGAFPPGLVLDLETTYCRRTIAQDAPVALHDAPNQGWEDDPAFEAHELHCYHGTTITVDEDTYGTVCFVSTGPRADPFESDETMFAELIARMLEHELQRRRTEAKIDQLDNFAGVVSHDLRSPLTVIQGWVELAQETSNVDHLEHVYPSVDRMRVLLEDVLAFAKDGAVIGEIEPVSIETVARTAWEHIETGPHELIVETDALILANPERLQATFENLFRNAVNHGSGRDRTTNANSLESHGSNIGSRGAEPESPGSEIDSPLRSDSKSRPVSELTITLEEIRDENGTATGFAVEDDGVGVPESERSSIFETGFTTADDGTGFGLSIVESIVRAHGWSIELIDGDRSGARFEITDVDFQ